MENCIFCKIIEKQEDAFIVWENDYVICFLAKEMEVIGHTLVIPKKHSENIFDTEEKYLAEVMKGIQITSKLLQKTLKTDGINILNANGAAAGQSVSHLHFHLMPRFKNDKQNLWPTIKNKNFNKEEIFSIIHGGKV